MKTNDELIQYIIQRGILNSKQIINAFYKVDRRYFVPPHLKDFTYEDRPLPIGKDQTISQPSTVAFMLELLEPKEGDNILDIGSGSGWTTALLCQIVDKKGSVIGLERVEELVEIGRENLSRFNIDKNCKIKQATNQLGIPTKKFDKILVSASSDDLPSELFDQLKDDGILVIPIKNSIFRFKKVAENKIQTQEYEGFVFVPLIQN